MKLSLTNLVNSIKDQEGYQQLVGLYQQLSTDQQKILKISVLSLTTVGLLYVTGSLVSQSYSLKNEYAEKYALYNTLTQASDEIRRLKGQNNSMNQGGAQDWGSALSGLSSMQGFSPEQTQVVSNTQGPTKGTLQESILQFQIKDAQVRPLTQLLVQMERASPPLKLKRLTIDSRPHEGKLEAQIFASGFMATASPTPQKK